jgi:hypothetical protein
MLLQHRFAYVSGPGDVIHGIVGVAVGDEHPLRRNQQLRPAFVP